MDLISVSSRIVANSRLALEKHRAWVGARWPTNPQQKHAQRWAAVTGWRPTVTTHITECWQIKAKLEESQYDYSLYFDSNQQSLKIQLKKCWMFWLGSDIRPLLLFWQSKNAFPWQDALPEFDQIFKILLSHHSSLKLQHGKSNI